MCEVTPSCEVGIGPPGDLTLPYFAYGAFKPDEPAYHLIREFVIGKPLPAEVRGCLLVRDGLPLLDPEAGDKVSGYVITFRPDERGNAYGAIGRFEPKGHYRWQVVSTTVGRSSANCLVGRKLGSGRPSKYEGNSWTFRNDPVFTQGLRSVAEAVDRYAQTEFASSPPGSFDWQRFFQLQMAYLLLWAAIERFASLSVGPGLSPLDKIKRISQDPDFGRSLKEIVTRSEKVSDARDPEDVYRLNPGDPARSIKYYYQVRNNLSHRGKGAWADGEIVRLSLRELSAVFRQTLRYKQVDV